MNTFPTFAEFQKQLNTDKMFYDMDQIAPQFLGELADSFTPEQYKVLSAMLTTASLSLLRAYHEWLVEQIAS